MRIPDTISSSRLCVVRTCPTTDADAPSMVNTTVKPAMNKRIPRSRRVRSVRRSTSVRVRTSPPGSVAASETSMGRRASSSAADIPEIIDTYPGTRGSTHGEMNESMPAPNATSRPSGSAWSVTAGIMPLQ